MIRATVPADTPALLTLAEVTGVFLPHEIQALREVLDDYHAANHAEGHLSVTAVAGDAVEGFAYYAPAAMTDRTWYLYWIAVAPNRQTAGLGTQLLRHAEDAVKAHNGRLLLIETSSLPRYEPARRFYRKHGYDEEAVLRDFYSDGDNLVVFRKRLT